ncbi:hypothetical protein P5673_021391, partial [Acropora cervicornis]
KSASQVLSSFVADEDENDRKSDFTSHGNAHVWNFVFVLVVTSRTGDGGGFRCGQNMNAMEKVQPASAGKNTNQDFQGGFRGEPTLSGNEDHDILFCRELLVTQPYVHKVRSIERAKAWEQIASNLNSIQAPKFRVTTRSLRDRYTHLTTRKAEQLRDEDRASGTEVTPTELDMLLEEILEKENTAKAEIESEDTKKRKAEQDKASADSIRRLAMERMSQTNTREGEVGETN